MAPSTGDRETEHLRVLVASERKDRLAIVAPIVVALGHEVIARETDVEDVGAVGASSSDCTSGGRTTSLLQVRPGVH